MSHSANYVLGFILGLAAALALGLVIGVIVRKMRGPCQYDERQMLARGKAYRGAFWTLIMYLLLNGLLYGATGILWAEPMTGSIIAVILAITVYAVICIAKDAYLPLKEKPRFYFELFGLLLVINVIVVARNLMIGNALMTNGMLNFKFLNLLVAVMLAVVIVTLALRQWVAKYAGDED